MDEFIQQIAREAGHIVRDAFGSARVLYTKKGKNDVVTEADLASNAFLVQRIRETYPDHGIVSEEMEDYQRDAEYVWYIDPLDGTLNFSRGIPLFGVMVGLAKNGKMSYGVVYDPVHDEMVFAQEGKGCYLNDKRVICSQNQEMLGSFIGLPSRFSSITHPFVEKLIQKAQTTGKFYISAIASAAIKTLYVANGRLDVHISVSSGIWDCAAPSVILSEAGCALSDMQGEEWTIEKRGLIAANPVLHAQILSTLLS